MALSRRERDVISALARGLSDKETGLELGIALGTVREYRKRVERKLGTKGLAQTMLVAWRYELLDLGALADMVIASIPRYR